MLALTAERKSVGVLVSILTEKLRTAPLTVAKRFSLKAARSQHGTNSGWFEKTIMPIQAVYLMLILWASRAAWRHGGRAVELTMCAWLVTAYCWAMTVMVLSMLRYMVPVMGLLFVLIPAVFLPKLATQENTNEGP